MTGDRLRVVVVDASVLINLLHVARLDFCSNLPGLRFLVPEHVREEILHPEQAAPLDQAITEGTLQLTSITDPEDIGLLGELTSRLGRGEAACLVLAIRNGWSVVSDDKKRFRREAVDRIGEDRILGTADLYIRAIGAGLVTIDEADADKEVLEHRRFKMPFRSFRERIQPWPEAE